MSLLRRFWRWLKEKVTGRRYFFGVDPAGPNGDYGAISIGYWRHDGVFVITECTTLPNKPVNKESNRG